MKAMYRGIQDSKIRESLKKLTGECWWAFNEKKFPIYAISLLAMIEGVLSEYSSDKQNARMMKVCQYHVDNFPAVGSTLIKHTWISYNSIIWKLYEKSDFIDSEPYEINRH